MKKSILRSAIWITCISSILLVQGCASQGGTATQAAAPAEETGTAAQPATSTEETGTADQADGALTSHDYTVYFGDPEITLENPYTLYFLNGAEDLPYVDLTEWAALFNETHKLAPVGVGVTDDKYQLTVTAEGDKVTYTRESGCTLVFDMAEDTLTFDDYDAFLLAWPHTSIVESVDSEGTGESGEINLLQRLPEESFDRYGSEIEIDLSTYEIDLVQKDGHYLAPLQTLNDLIVSPSMSNYYMFNGQAIFYATGAFMNTFKDLPDSMYQKYYSAPKGAKSQALADYSYNELCLALDCGYGLKETHDIQSFDTLFEQIGYEERLRSTDPAESDQALHDFIDFYLDDMHSMWGQSSYLSGMPEETDMITRGRASAAHGNASYSCMIARLEAYPDGCPPYEEVGNTAYLTLDRFTMSKKNDEWYSIENFEDYTSDTIGLVLYAHRQITAFKNGSMTDIDRGVEPDFYIDHYENFYDREVLTEWINGLF